MINIFSEYSYIMPNLDETIEKKLDEQLQKIKGDLIIFNTIQDLTEKIQKLEDELEKLNNKNKCSNSGKCMPCNLCSFSLF